MSEFWNEFKNGLNKSSLFDPFITTDAEHLRADKIALEQKQVEAQRTNFKGNQDLLARKRKLELLQLDNQEAKLKRAPARQAREDETAKINLEMLKRRNRVAGYSEKKSMIGEHSKTAMQNLIKSSEISTADMSDIERGELFKSKEFRDQHQFATFARLAINVLRSKSPEERTQNMELVNQYAGEYGYSIAEQDGQFYLSGENVPAGFILNEQNFAQMNNAVAKAYANEINLRKKLIKDKSSVYGVGRIDAINRITAVLPEDEKGSYSKASKIFAEIGKDMTRADVNTYSLRQNITKFLDDGTIDERERQALMQNMAILADATGTKYELGADGKPLVIREDGSRIGLKEFGEGLRSKDRLGNAIDKYETDAKVKNDVDRFITPKEKNGIEELIKKKDPTFTWSNIDSSQRSEVLLIIKNAVKKARDAGGSKRQQSVIYHQALLEQGLPEDMHPKIFREDVIDEKIAHHDSEVKRLLKEANKNKVTDADRALPPVVKPSRIGGMPISYENPKLTDKKSRYHKLRQKASKHIDNKQALKEKREKRKKRELLVHKYKS